MSARADIMLVPNMSPIDIGQAIRKERKALRKTQQDLANAAQCSRQTILDMEAGKNVSLHTLMASLAALGKGIAIIDTRPTVDNLRLLLDLDDDEN